ncbi:MAG TPA: DUF72 domain-containing protein [Chryseosolibacter sp.]|nr:DUF72 domain-containing protein [Chryseosolibacter sp.]
MKNWRIGCSGFYYRHWREKFYPGGLPVKKWFEFYCEYFNTVELNVTFYRLPKPDALRGWYDRSPENFIFTVKAPRLVTHYKRFKEAKNETRSFYDLMSKGLKDKLGTVLFQLHPRFEYTQENLERVLTTVDPAFNNVLEFRHPTWWNDEVYSELRKNKLTFCSISYPGLPDHVIKTAPVMYYRFHGVPDLYRSPYTPEELERVVHKIRDIRGLREVYIYFNNDIDVAAIDNARLVQGLVRGSGSGMSGGGRDPLQRGGVKGKRRVSTG